MPETYTPPDQVPVLDDLRADMKKAADEHPEYGSCPNCIKAVRVDKFGRLRDHTTPDLARGSLKANFRCPGSGGVYAEHGERGVTWDLAKGRWIDLPVDVPILFVAHPEATHQGVELPIWQLCEVPAQEIVRRGAAKLLDGSKWRIDLLFSANDVTGHLVQVDEAALSVVTTRFEEIAYGGLERLVTGLLVMIAND